MLSFALYFKEKTGLETKLKSYSTVSNLTYISKIIVEATCRQLALHSERNSLQETLQSAYKKRHSTETALKAVFDTLIRSLDKPNSAVLVAMLDMSAAFDIVVHVLLNTFSQRSVSREQ